VIKILPLDVGGKMRSIEELVEPDRVHRTVYTDQEIFDREIEQIFEKV